MTPGAWIALGLAGALAAGNWVSRGLGSPLLERLTKPTALGALIAVAVLLEPESPGRRTAFVVALVLSLTGDVLLMLPRERFVAGLVAFLGSHVAYIVGLRIGTEGLIDLLLPAAGVVVVSTLVGRPILDAVRSRHPALAPAVASYVAVISVMAAAALATHDPLAGAGALLFYASDGILAWNRFVHPMPWAPVAIMVTYHLGQAGLVLSLP